jgi:hypothetical protein
MLPLVYGLPVSQAVPRLAKREGSPHHERAPVDRTRTLPQEAGICPWLHPVTRLTEKPCQASPEYRPLAGGNTRLYPPHHKQLTNEHDEPQMKEDIVHCP